MSKDKILKSQNSVRTDYLICLIAISVLSVYYYGYRALAVMLIAVISSVATEIVCVKLMDRKNPKGDISAIISALIFSMLLPATVPYSIVAASCVFMIAIGKQAFGGNENRIFNCVAVAFCFATLCFKEYLYLYPTPVAYGHLDMSSYVSNTLVSSFTQTYSTVSSPSFNTLDLILGKIAGPMGVTNIVLIAICAMILTGRKSISFLAFTSFVGTMLATSFFFPYQNGINPVSSLIYGLFSGAMLFSATFLVSDLNYLPKRKFAKILYGVFVALLSILFTRYANYEIGVIFALILLNPMCDYIDKLSIMIGKGLIAIGKYIKTLPSKLLKLVVTICAVIYILIKCLIILIVKLFKKIIFKIRGNNGKKKIVISKDIDKETENVQAKEEVKIGE